MPIRQSRLTDVNGRIVYECGERCSEMLTAAAAAVSLKQRLFVLQNFQFAPILTVANLLSTLTLFPPSV